MSTHYETLQQADTYREAFAVEPPAALGERHLWPRKPGFFIVHEATAAAMANPSAQPSQPSQPPQTPPAPQTDLPAPPADAGTELTSEAPARPAQQRVLVLSLIHI